MATALTLAQMRDSIRRKIQVVPAVDAGGSSGAATTGQLEPNNATINDAVSDAIDIVNRLCRPRAVTDLSALSVAAAPSWKRGPLYVDFSGGLSSIDPLQTAEVAEAVWVDSNNAPTRLQPYNFNANQEGFLPFKQFPLGQKPTEYITVGSMIGLLPAPYYAGSLYLSVTLGLPQLTSDSATLPTDFPVPFHSVVQFIAVYLLMARQAQDVEAQDRFEKYRLLAQEGLQQIVAWKAGQMMAGNMSVQDTQRMFPLVLQAQRSGQNNQAAGGS